MRKRHASQYANFGSLRINLLIKKLFSYFLFTVKRLMNNSLISSVLVIYTKLDNIIV